MNKMTVNTLREKKRQGQKITMVTAYDYPSARLVEEAGLDMILVGDSLAMTMLGYDTTLPVTMDEMIHHTKAVTRGAPQTFVVGDLPFLSYHGTVHEAVSNAGRFLKEAGAQAVKLEGGLERLDVVRAIVSAGIPVIGHIGLTPQAVHQLGGFRVQGKDEEHANRLLEEAKALEKAGICGLVLECVPAPLAAKITSSLEIPTIGIGAGPQCDGQVLVWHDLLGILPGTKPRFVKEYAGLYPVIMEALAGYKKEVEEGAFPQKEHSFGMKTETLPKVYS